MIIRTRITHLLGPCYAMKLVHQSNVCVGSAEKKERTMIIKHIRFACILLTLSLAVTALQAASTVIRTLVYHEISSLTLSPIAGVGGTSQLCQ